MAEEKKLSGPGFTERVSLTEFSDGGMLQGHTQGESILVARRADAFFAIGASRTHYGPPLALMPTRDLNRTLSSSTRLTSSIGT
jgi:apoptosis-inducing factor 3